MPPRRSATLGQASSRSSASASHITRPENAVGSVGDVSSTRLPSVWPYTPVLEVNR